MCIPVDIPYINILYFLYKLMVTYIDSTLLELGCSKHGFIGSPLTYDFILFGYIPVMRVLYK